MTLFYTTFSYMNWSMHLASQDIVYRSKYKLVVSINSDFSMLILVAIFLIIFVKGSISMDM
jgi:hypothetical protein